MPQPRTKPRWVTFLVVVLLSITTLAAAQGVAKPNAADGTNEASETSNPAGMMLLDVFLLRPLGVAATVLGTAAFIVALPFSLPTGSADDAAKALVVKPAKYTFARPLGQVER